MSPEPFSTQDDVSELVEKSSKGEQGMLGLVAVALSGSPYILQRLEEYLDTILASQELGHKVSETQTKLQTLSESKGTLDVSNVLTTCIKDAALCESRLRKGSCDEVMSLALSTLQKMWPSLKANILQQESPAALADLQRLAEEATMAFPTHAEISALSVDLDKISTTREERWRKNELAIACGALVSVTDSRLTAQLSDKVEASRGLRFDSDDAEDAEHIKKIKGAALIIFDAYADCSAVANSWVMELLEDLIAMFNDRVLKVRLPVLASMNAMRNAMDDI